MPCTVSISKWFSFILLSTHTHSHIHTESLLTGSGVSEAGSLELRISQLRQQLDQRRAEVRRARGEQRQRKRALLRGEEDRLRRKLEVRDHISA